MFVSPFEISFSWHSEGEGTNLYCRDGARGNRTLVLIIPFGPFCNQSTPFFAPMPHPWHRRKGGNPKRRFGFPQWDCVGVTHGQDGWYSVPSVPLISVTCFIAGSVPCCWHLRQTIHRLANSPRLLVGIQAPVESPVGCTTQTSRFRKGKQSIPFLCVYLLVKHQTRLPSDSSKSSLQLG